jgi:hypothetical protein
VQVGAWRWGAILASRGRAFQAAAPSSMEKWSGPFSLEPCVRKV